MDSNKRVGRIVGILFLIIFAIGITAYQVLQGNVLFSDNFLASTAENSKQLIISTLLLFLSGIASIVAASLLFPIFGKHSKTLALIYLAFCILNFILISIDNYSVLSLLELSNEFNDNERNVDALTTLGNIFFKNHWWSHYLSLLISCFPVFILYFTLYRYRFTPKWISLFGIFAVILMFIEILFSILGNSISMNLLLPIGLIQLFLPLWLIFKGLDASDPVLIN